jgi:ubiquinol-cytochrome c reductase cytochrome c subunit
MLGAGIHTVGREQAMRRMRMTIQLLYRRLSCPSRGLAQRFKIGCDIAGLLLGQAEVGHVGLRFHRSGRLNPVNHVLRCVLKLTGDVTAARHLVKRRPDHSLGVGYSGNQVARAATELLDGRLSAARRAGNRCRVGVQFLAPGTTRQESGSSDDQAQDAQTRAHIDVRCGSRQKSFSPKAPIANAPVTFCHRERGRGNGIRHRRSLQCAQHRILGIVAGAVGLVFAFLFAGPAAFCEQGPSSPPDGGQVFSHYCARCHGDRGQGISAVVTYAGPSLQAEHNAGNVMMALEVGPEHMPRFQYVLSGDQMHAVSQYVVQNLAVIPLSGGNVSEGGELYRTHCASCHRTAVGGGALAFVGLNAPSLVNKSPALIAGAIRWGPGPMPSFPPSILTDHQLDSIVDYIVTVQHPARPGGNPMNWYGPVAEGVAAWVTVLILILFSMWAERGGKG